MAQFAVYKNKNPKTKAAFPFLVDVQSDLLEDLQTRVVIPLSKAPALTKKPLATLTPILQIDGDKYLLVAPHLAGIARSELGTPVANIADQRQAIVAALDLLITGI